MTSYRDQQKELRRPDELQKIGASAVPWVEQHGKTVAGAVVAAVGLAGAIMLVREMATRGEERASHEFGAALRVLDRPVNATPPSTPAPGEEPAFKSEAEKDQALVKSLTDFRAKNAGRKAAASAALPLAQALLRQGKPADALPLIDEFLTKAEPNDVLRPAALEARGYALEAQQKYDEALAAFDQLSQENKTDFMKGMGMYHRARLLLLKGDKDGAAKLFSDLETSAPGTAAARLAKERVTILAGQGVVIPAPTPVPTAAADAGK